MGEQETYPEDLKMFTAAQEEWCIAKDPEDAAKAYEEFTGAEIDFEYGEHLSWTEEPPSKIFGFTGNDGGATRKTCAQWARDKGRGYFANANAAEGDE